MTEQSQAIPVTPDMWDHVESIQMMDTKPYGDDFKYTFDVVLKGFKNSTSTIEIFKVGEVYYWETFVRANLGTDRDGLRDAEDMGDVIEENLRPWIALANTFVGGYTKSPNARLATELGSTYIQHQEER